MEKLQRILGLSSDQIESLKKARIDSVRKFLARKDYQLSRILEVSMTVVNQMKERLEQENSFTLVDGSKFLVDSLARGLTYKTGIEQFDELFAERGIIKGDIIEIFGLPESGKTMLLNTIMINFLKECHSEYWITFVNTKQEFQALRLKHMMEAQAIPETIQYAMLGRITVEQALTLEELIKILENIAQHPEYHQGLRIIMIDSIAIPFYLYIGCPSYMFGLLDEVVQLLKNLSMLSFTIFLTNAALPVYAENSEETQSSANSEAGSPKEQQPQLKPALGKMWETVAFHKVLINFFDFPRRFDQPILPVTRQISLFTSKTLASTSPKLVTINDNGVS